jgi:hypothetical protein
VSPSPGTRTRPSSCAAGVGSLHTYSQPFNKVYDCPIVHFHGSCRHSQLFSKEYVCPIEQYRGRADIESVNNMYSISSMTAQ